MPVVQCNGADLYYEDAGDGDPIVFLHGAWAGLRYFGSQLQGLSDDYHTIAFNFRGHGRSETTEAGHTIAQYARDLSAFLDRRDVDDVVLVGWSLGALVIWEYVDQFGTDRVRALVNVDMEPSPGRWDDDSDGRYDADVLASVHDAIHDDHWQLVEESQSRLFKDTPSEEMRTMMFDEMTRCPPSIKSSIILDATTSDYADVLPGIDVPMLVCASEDEKWRSVASVRAVADEIPDAQFELFEHSGHCITLEEPDRFNRVLRQFVESH